MNTEKLIASKEAKKAYKRISEKGLPEGATPIELTALVNSLAWNLEQEGKDFSEDILYDIYDEVLDYEAFKLFVIKKEFKYHLQNFFCVYHANMGKALIRSEALKAIENY